MAKKQVNATRMELLRLRRRSALARKGHKLLKDKLDGLIQQLLGIVRGQRHLSEKLERELIEIFQKLVLSSAQIDIQTLDEAAQRSECRIGVNITLKNIMGVKIPKHELSMEGDPSYPFEKTTGELDIALARFREILKELVLLAEQNKAILTIASHIIEIKRRVNALEYVLIPELDGAVRFIKMKLAEIERSTTVSLLKIKDIVRAR